MSHRGVLGGVVVVVVLLTALLAGCGDDESTPSSTEAESTTSTAASLTSVSVALEYTYGAGNIAVYIADELGYFADEGIDVTIVPWSSTTRSDALAAAGTVNLALAASLDDVLIAVAQGSPITAVMVTVQHDPAVIGVAADSGITRPAELDGKVYAGWGSLKEPILVHALVTGDGGNGDVEIVSLLSAAYDAVYSGEADAGLFYVYSDLVEAEVLGKDILAFAFRDYGLPDQYGPMLVANNTFLSENPEAVGGVVRALVRAYQYQADNPEQAVELLVEAAPGIELDFANGSMASFNGDFLFAPDGSIGTMTLEMWETRGNFWVDNGVLVDSEGNVITEPLDYSQYFTNDFLANP